MKELLFSITKKDFKIDYFSGTGSGGQHRNKHQNCVRLQHLDSGIIVTGQSYKERLSNIKEALNNLKNHPKFKIWLNRKVFEYENKITIEEIVDKTMDPKNLKIEIKDENNKWIIEK